MKLICAIEHHKIEYESDRVAFCPLCNLIKDHNYELLKIREAEVISLERRLALVEKLRELSREEL